MGTGRRGPDNGGGSGPIVRHEPGCRRGNPSAAV